MKRNHIWLLTISVIILVFDIAMSFILNAYGTKITANDTNILYICSKVLFVVAYLAVVIFGLLKKDVANYAIQYIASVVVQFIPLIIRYVSIVSNGFVISIVIFFAALLVYCGIVLGLWVLSQKTRKASVTLEGKRIPVKEEEYE